MPAYLPALQFTYTVGTHKFRTWSCYVQWICRFPRVEHTSVPHTWVTWLSGKADSKLCCLISDIGPQRAVCRIYPKRGIPQIGYQERKTPIMGYRVTRFLLINQSCSWIWKKYILQVTYIYFFQCLSTSSSVPLACHSSSVLISFTALWNLACKLDVCVSVCLLMPETPGGNQALCRWRASMEQDAKLTEGTVTWLSVSSDLFQVRASLFRWVCECHCTASEASSNKTVKRRRQRSLLQCCQLSVKLSVNSRVKCLIFLL